MPVYEYDCTECDRYGIEIDCNSLQRRDQDCPDCQAPLGRQNINANFSIGTPRFKGAEIIGSQGGRPIISLNGTGPVGDGGCGEMTE